MGIELFMWGYQPHFRVAAKIFAKKIFNILDKNLKPEIFLVGFLLGNREGFHPICIEPEDGKYEPSNFWNTINVAEGLEKADKRSGRFIFGPDGVEDDYRYQIKGDSLKTATENTLNEIEPIKISFCSFPVLVDGYHVMVILQLDRISYESHYSLTKKEIKGRTVPISLLEATKEEYLNECERALKKPNPGKGTTFYRNANEIIRSAGNYLMYTPAFAGNNLDGLGGLFECCNSISSLRYEGEESSGKMIIAKQYDNEVKKTIGYHPNIKNIVKLEEPVEIYDYRAVRKLLEMSSENISILCDSYENYGLGKVINDYNSNREDLFLINFTKHYHWELLHEGHILMKVAYGQPYLPENQIDEDKFKSDINRIFGNEINNNQIEKIWELVVAATKQKHGTMVVISKEAESEAERLKNQCTKIEQLELTPELMNIVTPIDGSVLINQNGVCFAIGVILDGIASKNGTSARGARFNSAIRYVEYIKSPCLAVVISEDGMIDLIPDLMPQISRAKLEEMLNNLRSINDSDNDDFKEFYRVIRWFDDHRFYLNFEICIEINEIKKKFYDKMTENSEVKLIYPDFKPNEDLTDEYFVS